MNIQQFEHVKVAYERCLEAIRNNEFTFTTTVFGNDVTFKGRFDYLNQSDVDITEMVDDILYPDNLSPVQTNVFAAWVEGINNGDPLPEDIAQLINNKLELFNEQYELVEAADEDYFLADHLQNESEWIAIDSELLETYGQDPVQSNSNPAPTVSTLDAAVVLLVNNGYTVTKN